MRHLTVGHELQQFAAARDRDPGSGRGDDVDDPDDDLCRTCGHERAWHYSTCIASILKCADLDSACDATECGHGEGCYAACECEAFVEPEVRV